MTDAETADALLALWDTGGQVDRIETPDMGAAIRVTANVRARREARGERVVGRKIGFSNRSMWPIYGVDRPIWGYVWDTTLTRAPEGSAEVDARRWPEPRIEPEIALELCKSPENGMNDAEIWECVGRLAGSFEVVQSIFPEWSFTGPMAAAAFALHGHLVTGPWVAAEVDWLRRLEGLEVTLSRGETVVEVGNSANVLGSPIIALRHLVETLHREGAPPLQAGEIVTTGTMTDAWPVASGEAWSMQFDSDALPPLSLTFR